MKKCLLFSKKTVDVNTGSRRFSIIDAPIQIKKNNNPDRLIDIINYLDVENSRRYKPNRKQGSTYCNIYAHDYCFLSGVYLPRVWWNEKEVDNMINDPHYMNSIAIYRKTCHEMSANALYEWLINFGKFFGWKESSDNKIQKYANQGKICVISGFNNATHLNKSKTKHFPGHITIVVPDINNERRIIDSTEVPLQSQAGYYNHKYFAYEWWKVQNKWQDFSKTWKMWIN